LFPAVKHFRYCFLVNPRGVVADMAAGIKFWYRVCYCLLYKFLLKNQSDFQIVIKAD
jgi:hypothetical protein